jgi:hypothetical protein
MLPGTVAGCRNQGRRLESEPPWPRTALRRARGESPGVYVCDVDEPAIHQVIPGPKFPYMGLRKGVPIPDDCFTRRWLRSGEVSTISDLRDVPPHHWIERSSGIAGLFEQVLSQVDGWSSTLLTVELQDEDDDESDDRASNRR